MPRIFAPIHESTRMKCARKSLSKSLEIDRLHLEVGKLFDQLYLLSMQRLEHSQPMLYRQLIEVNRKRPRIVIAIKSRRTLTLGHYSPNRWGDARQAIDEIAILPETTSAGVHDTANTLVHELAHYFNEALQIPDTSREGRYHNGRYKQMAESLGLEVHRVPTYGYAATTLSEKLHKQVDTLVNRKQVDPSVFHLKRQQTRASATLVKLACPNCDTFAYVLKNRIDSVHLICGPCKQKLVEP